jgi:hypothetical protein
MFALFKKKKTVLVASVIILAAAVTVAAVYFISAAKPARDFYFKAESKNFKLYADWIKENYGEFVENQKPYLAADYKRRTELTAEVGSSGGKPFGLENAEGIFDIVKRCKLIVDTKRSPAKKTSLTDISLLLEKTPFADAVVFRNDRRLYFTVPVLTPNRYFTLDLDKIDAVYDRFGIPVKPQRLINSADIAETVKFDGNELDKSAAGLGDFISGLIQAEDVSYGGNAELTLSGKKAAGREVLVKLDAKKSGELFKGLAQRYAADKSLVALTYGNAAAVSELLAQAGLFRLFEYLDTTGTVVLNESEKELVDRLNITYDAEGFTKTLIDAANSLDFPEGINMKLVIDKSGNILDRTLDAVVADTRGKGSLRLSIHTGCSSMLIDDCRNRFAEVVIDGADSAGKDSRSALKLNSVFAPLETKGDEEGILEVSWSNELDGVQQAVTGIRLDLTGSTDPLTLKKRNICKYNIEMKYAGMDKANSLNGEVNTESWSNKKQKTRNWTSGITVNADMPSFGVQDFSAVLKLAREDKLEIEAFELPAVGAPGTVDLNTATDEELGRVRNEILASFGVFYMTNKPIIDALMGK